MKKSEVNPIYLSVLAIISLSLIFFPAPQGLSQSAWTLFAIFIFTVGGLIIKAAPMGTMSMLGIALTALSKEFFTGNPKKAIEIAFSGFNNAVIWLIVLSFFISRGFIKTGLGTRIACLFVKAFGKSPLGIAYSLNTADLLLAPAIPSNTARGGGIIYPIMKSICNSFNSTQNGEVNNNKIASFLTLAVYNGDLITSAMFLTATAGNPLCQKLAQEVGISLSWGLWAYASLVPGLITFLVMPWFLNRVYPPNLKDTRQAQIVASEKLRELGPLRRDELIMVVCFFFLITLWILGENIGLDATITGLLGLCLLLLSSVLTWEDIIIEKGAWDTLVWFSALVMLGTQLNSEGFIPWLASGIKSSFSHLSWNLAFPLIILSYCYSHYFFASATAHVASMYGAFLSLGIALGIPGKLLALMLGMMTSLMGTQTHYGHGPAPVFFGSGFVELKEWWTYGFILSIIYIIIFMIMGGIWWKIIGIY